MSEHYKNPYQSCIKELGPGAVIKLNSVIPLDAYNSIRVLRVKPGTIQTTINLLWKKLIDECKSRGIQSITDSPKFERLVAESRLMLPEELSGSATVKSDSKTDASNVGGGNKRQGSTASRDTR